MFQYSLVVVCCLFGVLHSVTSSQCRLTTETTSVCEPQSAPGEVPDPAADLKQFKMGVLNSLAQINASLKEVSDKLIAKLDEAIDKLKESNDDSDEPEYENANNACSDFTQDGKFNLTSGVEVLCSGGWTVIQRRWSGNVNFKARTWDEYKNGFGDLSSEFWWGLENLHRMTKNGGCRLNLEIWFPDANPAYSSADYGTFQVANESELYRLQVSGYSGNAGDSLTPANDPTKDVNGMYFSTPDSDNDNWLSGNCAEMYGGFWHNSCTYARLNADWNPQSSAQNTISWFKRLDTWGGIDTTDVRVRCD